MALSLLSAVQKALIGAPITLGGFLIPVIYGGVTGALIGLWMGRLQERNHQLERVLVARRWMLRDLHHRIQNNLQMVASIIDMERSRDAAGEWSARLRIDLIAGIHQTLYDMDAQYEVPFNRFVRRHLAYVYGRSCGNTLTESEDSDATHLVVVPLDTAVVAAMIMNEMLAEVVDYMDCDVGSSLSITCTTDGGVCEVTVFLPDQVVAKLPEYADDRERIRFRTDLITALADQISGEVHISWEPTLRGTIRFSLDAQRWYGDVALPDEPIFREDPTLRTPT